MLAKICSFSTTGTELWFVAVLLLFPVLSPIDSLYMGAFHCSVKWLKQDPVKEKKR